MKELANRIEEKLKKCEWATEVKYFNRYDLFYKQAEKEVKEEIELGIIDWTVVPYGDKDFKETIKITAEQRTERFFARCYTNYEEYILKTIIEDLEANIRWNPGPILAKFPPEPLIDQFDNEGTLPSDINTCISGLEKVSDYPFREVLINYFGLNQHIVDKLMDRPVMDRGEEITYL